MLMFFVTTNSKSGNVKKSLTRVFHYSVHWVIGYGGMWIMKWVLGSLMMRDNLFELAFDHVRLRMAAGNQSVNYSRIVKKFFIINI